MKNPWEIIRQKIIYSNPWIDLIHYDVLNPSGKPGIYGKVHFKNIAIGIIPLDEELNTWIVGQYRFPLQQYSWEIPEGGGPLNEDILKSAKRELLEECGIVAQKWDMLLNIHLSNSVSDEFGVVYIAKNLTFEAANPDENEQLVTKKIPFNALFNMVMNGEITDSLTVAGVLKLQHILNNFSQ